MQAHARRTSSRRRFFLDHLAPPGAIIIHLSERERERERVRAQPYYFFAEKVRGWLCRLPVRRLLRRAVQAHFSTGTADFSEVKIAPLDGCAGCQWQKEYVRLWSFCALPGSRLIVILFCLNLRAGCQWQKEYGMCIIAHPESRCGRCSQVVSSRGMAVIEKGCALSLAHPSAAFLIRKSTTCLGSLASLDLSCRFFSRCPG